MKETFFSRQRIFLAFCICALALAAIQAWAARFDMAPDGIQYLDNADAYGSGDWTNAANTQWSPMYPWLLAIALKVLHPQPYWEFPVLHLVNFVIFICVLAAFRYFITSFSTLFKPGVLQSSITAVACASYLYAMLDFTNVVNPTPDLTMAVFVFLLAGLIIKISSGQRSLGTYLALGLILGLGYLAKAPFFVFAVVLLVFLAMLVLRGKIRVAHFALAVAGFGSVALPYIAFISIEKHRLTYGDSGRYNVIWMVNRVPYYHWQGEPAGSAVPLHPTRRLSTNPGVYEFGVPIAGTYPPWYDPIYWCEGARVQYRPADFLRAIIRTSRGYFWLFHHRQSVLIAGLVILALIIRRPAPGVYARFGPIFAFAAFPFAMYWPVHVDGRFLGASFVLLWSTLFGSALWSARDVAPRVLSAVCTVVSVFMLIEAALVAVPTPPLTGPQDPVTSMPSRALHSEIAMALQSKGIHPGARAAIIGDDLPYYWARLARVRIVAQMFPSATQYDPATLIRNTEEWRKARETLLETSAQFVISPMFPGIVDQPGWERIGSSGIYLYKFAR